MLLAHVVPIVVKPRIAVVYIFFCRGQFIGLYGSFGPSKSTIELLALVFGFSTPSMFMSLAGVPVMLIGSAWFRSEVTGCGNEESRDSFEGCFGLFGIMAENGMVVDALQSFQ